MRGGRQAGISAAPGRGRGSGGTRSGRPPALPRLHPTCSPSVCASLFVLPSSSDSLRACQTGQAGTVCVSGGSQPSQPPPPLLTLEPLQARRWQLLRGLRLPMGSWFGLTALAGAARTHTPRAPATHLLHDPLDRVGQLALQLLAGGGAARGLGALGLRLRQLAQHIRRNGDLGAVAAGSRRRRRCRLRAAGARLAAPIRQNGQAGSKQAGAPHRSATAAIAGCSAWHTKGSRQARRRRGGTAGAAPAPGAPVAPPSPAQCPAARPGPPSSA